MNRFEIKVIEPQRKIRKYNSLKLNHEWFAEKSRKGIVFDGRRYFWQIDKNNKIEKCLGWLAELIQYKNDVDNNIAIINLFYLFIIKTDF